MIKKFFVFGNIGKMTELPKSGGQSSARRVMQGLERMGYETVPIVRRRCVLEGKIIHFLETRSFAVIDLLKILRHIVPANRKTSAFLTLTFGGKLAPYELLISVIVRMLGLKTVTYMQGGQFIDFYNRGSKFYRWLIKKNMDLQSQVWFEGMPSLEVVRRISDTPLVYYPSYVDQENIVSRIPERPKDRLNLCYFGRVTPEKNVDVIIKTFHLLCEKYDDVYLTVIGGSGYSKAYVEEVDGMIENSPFKSHITRKGLTPFDEIKEIMQSQHLFVFPTKERCEGHSNSLNEAMAQGVVPIVSDYHFNRDIVGDDRLAVNGWEPQDYADRIAHIRETCDLQEIAVKMRNRVMENYSREVVNKRLFEELKKI